MSVLQIRRRGLYLRGQGGGVGAKYKAYNIVMEAHFFMKLDMDKTRVGMLFGDDKEAHVLYTNYAQQEGFGIVLQRSLKIET